MEPDNLSVVCEMLKPEFEFSSSAVSESQAKIKTASVCAALSILHEIKLHDVLSSHEADSLPRQLLDNTLQVTLKLLEYLIHVDDMENMKLVSDALGQLIKERPVFFRFVWNPLFEVIQVACQGDDRQNDGVSDDSVKCALLDMMHDLLLNPDSAPFCSNAESRVGALMLCFTVLHNVDMEHPGEQYFHERLLTSDDCFGDEDGEEPPSFSLATSLLGSYIREWPIEETMPCCQTVLKALKTDNKDFASLRCALFVTSVLFDLLGVEMQQQLSFIVPTLQDLTEHPHPRIRLCSLICFKSLVTSDSDEEEQQGFREVYHGMFFRVVMNSIGSNTSFPKIACQGVNTLLSFCDPQVCKSEVLAPHVSAILDMCWEMMCHPECPRFLLMECLPLIGNVAVIDSDSFAPYYSNFMNAIHSMLMANPSRDLDKDSQEFKGKCLESCALMGSSVGYETFLSDGTKLLEYMIHHMSSRDQSSDFSDILSSYIVQSFARIAGVLGPSFQPYLCQVMPTLLSLASQRIEHNVQLEGELRGSSATDDDYVTLYQRGVGNIRFLCNSHAMKEKEMVLRSLYQFLLDMPGLMLPYARSSIHAVTALSPLQLCSEDNVNSLEIIGALLSDAVKTIIRLDSNCSDLTEIIHAVALYCLETLHDASKQDHLNFSAAAVDNMRLILQILAESNGRRKVCLPQSVGQNIFSCFEHQIALWLQRKHGRDTSELSEYFIPGDETQVECDMWLGLTDAVGYLFKSIALNEACALFQEGVMPFLQSIGSRSDDNDIQSMLISVLTDAVEAFSSVPHVCNAVIEVTAPLLFKNYGSSDMATLCTYGIGVCALHADCGEAWNAYREVSAPTLQRYLELVSEEELDEELKGTIISALFKVAVGQNHPVGLLLEVLSTMLPMECFPYEARECHSLVISLMMAEDTRLIGSHGESLPYLLVLLARLARLHAEAVRLLNATASFEMNQTLGLDNSDFWDEQFVSEDLNEKLQSLFSQWKHRQNFCGLDRVGIMSIAESLPVSEKEMIIQLINA